MGITFHHPWLLGAAALLALIVLVLEWRIPGRGVRRAARFVVRSLLLALLVAALAGPHRVTRVPLERRLVIAVDRSTRLRAAAREEADALIARAQGAATREGLAFSVVGFTTRAAAPGTVPPTSEDSAAAAGLAGARLEFRRAETGAVLLITDGHGHLEGLGMAAAALRGDGFGVTAAAVPRAVVPAPAAPGIQALHMPRHARGPFAVRAAFTAPQGEALIAVLRVDGTERQRLAAPAQSEILFDALDLAPGLHEIAVALEAGEQSADAVARTQALARAHVEVGEPPRVLALLGDAAGSPFRKALGAQGLSVAAIEPDALAGRLAEDRGLPDLILADAAALAALGPEAAGLLAQRVREGLGLLVEAGGSREAWEALATGPLAALLPLMPLPEPLPPPPTPAPPPEDEPEPPIEPPEPADGPGLKAERRPEEALPITLLLVVDRSWSMEGMKLQLAIEGARRAAMALSPWDRVGVITFAHDSTLDVPPRSARSASSLNLWLSTVAAGGEGTNIFGALQLASRVMAKETSPILHVILLTDGRQYPDGPIFGPVVKPMRDRGITITAVGIGRGARMDQLRDIVLWAAGGMTIPVADAAQLPTVLTRDTHGLAQKRSEDAQALARLRDPDATLPPTPPPTEPEPTPPPRPRRPDRPRPTPPEPVTAGDGPALPLRQVRAHEALAGLDATPLPAVGAPRRAEATPQAALLLEREDGKPVLAAGRAGVGRVLVWSLPPRDAGALAWPGLGRLVGQCARAVMAPRGAFAYLPEATVVQTPDGASLQVIWPRGETRGALDVRWSLGDRTQALGRFTPGDDAPRPLPEAAGGALCRLDLSLEGGPTLPPLTYRARSPTSGPPRVGDPAALAAALGEPLQRPDTFVAAVPGGERERREAVWALFLWAVLALLPLDVWLHRRGRTP